MIWISSSQYYTSLERTIHLLSTSYSVFLNSETLEGKIRQHGLSLVELLLAVVIGGILLAGIDGLLGSALLTEWQIRSRNDTLQQARFAIQQMLRAVSGSQRLLIPLVENPATAWSESVRDVLAVTLDPTLDRDKDGWADANNDKDYLDNNQNGSRDAGEPERIDEDPSSDTNNDGGSGVVGIDDNDDGSVDNGRNSNDDDEDGVMEEDPVNGMDDDGDGAVDEAPLADAENDNAPGLPGVDDDLDGSTDEGLDGDNDEDGSLNEDWLDTVVFFLDGTTLMERIPSIDPADGTDYGEYALTEDVSQLRIERLVGGDGVTVLVDITLTLSPAGVEPVTVNARIRVGGAL